MDFKPLILESLTKRTQGVNDATLYWGVRVEHQVALTKEEFEFQLARLMLEGKVQRKLNNRLYPVLIRPKDALTKPTNAPAWSRNGN